jgi:uncharacterized protein (TIGR02757 family)
MKTDGFDFVKNSLNLGQLKKQLEILYGRYNQPHFIHPDPLEFLFRYPQSRDREIVALIASALAYGRVTQILVSISKALEPLGPSPFLYLMGTTKKRLIQAYMDFRHRFTSGKEMATMLWGVRRVVMEYGSLQACFVSGMEEDDRTVLPGLSRFVRKLWMREHKGFKNTLLPCPERGSACKRLNLFMRWMVRKDAVDPGGWERVPSSKLVVPLDTHMFKMSRFLTLTDRRRPDMTAALSITKAFRNFRPEDPVRYDFALTRLGIRKGLEIDRFFQGWEGQEADLQTHP